MTKLNSEQMLEIFKNVVEALSVIDKFDDLEDAENIWADKQFRENSRIMLTEIIPFQKKHALESLEGIEVRLVAIDGVNRTHDLIKKLDHLKNNDNKEKSDTLSLYKEAKDLLQEAITQREKIKE